jgi:hypothetical protein
MQSINNVTTNPVSFKVVRGDWDRWNDTEKYRNEWRKGSGFPDF